MAPTSVGTFTNTFWLFWVPSWHAPSHRTSSADGNHSSARVPAQTVLRAPHTPPVSHLWRSRPLSAAPSPWAAARLAALHFARQRRVCKSRQLVCRQTSSCRGFFRGDWGRSPALRRLPTAGCRSSCTPGRLMSRSASRKRGPVLYHPTTRSRAARTKQLTHTSRNNPHAPVVPQQSRALTLLSESGAHRSLS